MNNGIFNMSGRLVTKLIKRPSAPFVWKIRNIFRWSFIRSLIAVYIGVPVSRFFGLFVTYGTLKAVLIKANGDVIDYGLLTHRVVTTAFASFVTDQLQTETSAFGDFKYHDSGVGVTAENAADVDIETTDGEARVAGTQTESAATVYRSVGQITYSTSKAITEHGLFNALTGGTLLDRSVFAAINVNNGDKIEFDYSLTSSAGS